MPVDVDPAERDDVDSLTELWVDLASEQRTVGSHLRSEENRATVRESMARHAIADGLYVARDDGIVGFVMFDLESTTHTQDVRRGIVRNLYVVPSRRSEGIGSRLLAAAEGELAAADVDAVALETLADNEDARRFYERHGYRVHRLELEKRVETDTRERG